MQIEEGGARGSRQERKQVAEDTAAAGKHHLASVQGHVVPCRCALSVAHHLVFQE